MAGCLHALSGSEGNKRANLVVDMPMFVDHVLQPSLTGNGAKVAIICNVTPASSQSEETWNTLRFADGAKRIKVGPDTASDLDSLVLA